VLVQQVVPGSIAQRSGLKQGDIIVSVGGAQVGYSNGRVVDLIYEINRRVDSNGQVRLTVLESTSRQLRTYNLNIAQRPVANFTVSGRLFVDSGVLSYGSNTIKVELLNVTRPYMTASGGST
jgi:C-terminal processing protease CtpA/Prc